MPKAECCLYHRRLLNSYTAHTLGSYSEINVMLKAFQMNKCVKEMIIVGHDRAVGLIFEADSNK